MLAPGTVKRSRSGRQVNFALHMPRAFVADNCEERLKCCNPTNGNCGDDRVVVISLSFTPLTWKRLLLVVASYSLDTHDNDKQSRAASKNAPVVGSDQWQQVVSL